MIYGLWNNPVYAQTAGLVLAGLLVLLPILWVLKRRGPPFTAAWHSILSWIVVAPALFAIFAAPAPWPLVFVTWMGILCSKTFFQMVGMYHRSWFVICTYLGIIGLGYLIYSGHLDEYYNISPMVFLFIVSIIPLMRNSATNMIQYLALTLLAFIFWGWSYMHMARLLTFEGGPLLVLYLYLLCEVSENVSWACSKLFGKIKPFSRISAKVTLEGMVVALSVTMLLAWGLRHLLPNRAEHYWIAAGLIAGIFGRFGDLILSVIRRDLGIKNTGVFIFGRDDILTRLEKLIFVGPLFFYTYLYLQQVLKL
jgi:phosphatidate cytidylyltransferase